MRKVLKYHLTAMHGHQWFRVPLVTDSYGFHVDGATGEFFLLVSTNDKSAREKQVDIVIVDTGAKVESVYDYVGSSIMFGKDYHVYAADMYDTDEDMLGSLGKLSKDQLIERVKQLKDDLGNTI